MLQETAKQNLSGFQNPIWLMNFKDFNLLWTDGKTVDATCPPPLPPGTFNALQCHVSKNWSHLEEQKF
jgi:hypothetical protein